MKYLGKNLTNNVKDLHIEFSKILLNKRRDSSWISKGPNIKMPILLKLMCSLAQMVKRLPAIWETWIWSLGQEDPLEEETTTHSNTLAWRIPWTEESGGLQFVGLQRVSEWASNFHYYRLYIQWNAWEIFKWKFLLFKLCACVCVCVCSVESNSLQLHGL